MTTKAKKAPPTPVTHGNYVIRDGKAVDLDAGKPKPKRAPVKMRHEKIREAKAKRLAAAEAKKPAAVPAANSKAKE